MFDTPVALIVFNRPDTTARVLERIAQVQPRQLFVIGDAPRAGRADDVENCAAVQALLDQVSWKCEIVTHFATANLGCQQRVATGLTWLFEQAPEAIILEDDCVPDPTFFPFCQEMLARYRTDTRIMHIGGSNFQMGYRRNAASYYFSRFVFVWGWATWRRAWQHYDVTMASWPHFREGGWLLDWVGDRALAAYCRYLFQLHYEHSTTWDFQWLYSCWTQGALSIVPNINLVENIGGAHAAATHAATTNWLFTRKSSPMPWPLVHPAFRIPDARADKFTQMTMYRSTLFDRVYGKLWRLWRQRRAVI